MIIPKDNISLLALIVSFSSVFISILLFIIQLQYNKHNVANNVRTLIDAYLISFEKKIEQVERIGKWERRISFEEYNHKNYEILESFLAMITSLRKDEQNTFIDFIVNIKTTDEMNLTRKDITGLSKLKNEIKKLRQTFPKRKDA